MNILAVDSSGKRAGAAIMSDGNIIAEILLNTGLTHSEMLMVVIDKTFELSKMTPSDIDFFSATTGPGSFTGLRIGISTIKGLSMGVGKMCISVPTLRAMAEISQFPDTLIVPVIDARRSRVYSSVYLRNAEGTLSQLITDSVFKVTELYDIVTSYKKPVSFVGDIGIIKSSGMIDGITTIPLPDSHSFLRASHVAVTAAKLLSEGIFCEPELFNPHYLLPSQAEREYNKNKQQNNIGGLS
ncbi:MAG: tRNA (adenosine(37)-N6)-threonylcarbamoyltransferase complex dimerization subunit type 1 TsaB [Ruminococcaceae bacterium]|mgnify:CR=1 FL=1|nr:tRNA (adenosine(37)-N6)-threonylcarbamoyltransferase complex dimerization subunit type 1 TsaB [Oscillospiraceae bacterium]